MTKPVWHAAFHVVDKHAQRPFNDLIDVWAYDDTFGTQYIAKHSQLGQSRSYAFPSAAVADLMRGKGYENFTSYRTYL